MSWSYSKTGRASKLGAVVASQMAAVGGAPAGSAEETAKNALGGVAETLCKSLPADTVVQITAQGSAYNAPEGARSQYVDFKLNTIGDFVE